MFAVLLFVMAAVSAAPRFPHGPPPYAPGPYRPAFYNDRFSGEFFDTRVFWADLNREMQEIDSMIASLSQHFPSHVPTYKIEGNEYTITIPLNGFEEKDIAVKAKEGFLMVQAVHQLPEGGVQSYIDAKTIPANVNVTGTWTFNQGILKIVFPLKSSAEVTTETVVTRKPFIDREEVESDSTEVKDADVGLRGDNELFTNEIPRSRVDSTTYAVDLKNEVEFVPVRNNN